MQTQLYFYILKAPVIAEAN